MKIIEDINNLFYSLQKKKSAAEISRIFGYERKWLYQRQQVGSFVINDKFLAGLNEMGYELILKKKDLIMDKERLEKITEKFCDNYCKYPCQTKDQNDLDDICEECPMNELFELLD